METHPVDNRIPWERSLRYDAVVIVMVVLVLIVGWSMKSFVEGERTTFTDAEAYLTLRYPASWTALKEKGRLLSVRNLRSEGSFKVGLWLEVKSIPSEAIKSVKEYIAPLSVDRGQQLTGYRILSVGETQVGGIEAVELAYTYVDLPMGTALQSSLPIVVRAIDILFANHDLLYVLTFVAPTETFQELSGIFDDIRNSVILIP
jgi:hypothetical protein